MEARRTVPAKLDVTDCDASFQSDTVAQWTLGNRLKELVAEV